MKSYRFLGAWLLLMAAAMPAFGQKYDYQLRVNDVGAIKKIYLGYWYGGKALLLDSAQIDQVKNTAQFAGNKSLPAGQYFFANDLSTATLDFIINGENNLEFSTTSGYAWADSFFVAKSKENTPYFFWKNAKKERE